MDDAPHERGVGEDCVEGVENGVLGATQSGRELMGDEMKARASYILPSPGCFC